VVPGQEGGHALASICWRYQPIGKLPCTFGVKREDYPDYGNFPGTGIVKYAKESMSDTAFDKKGIATVFPSVMAYLTRLSLFQLTILKTGAGA